MKQWISVPLAIVAGDGILKKIAQRQLADGKTRPILGGRIRLRLFHNKGVALCALEKRPKLVLAVNSALLGAACCEFFHILKRKGETVAKTGLALLIGGGASNLLDRLQRGYVTDYFSIHAGERCKRLQTIIFNCSDFCVFTGILLYIFGKKD